ncbi:polyhydroxyalkanoate synthesis regulator DNA-binding domain-containing protein [Methylobacterium nonmethylotrophicum]|uniref:PHA accumulation regulator DNA-binding N-terminal domain-containing protein n=1 Tax=Methylobacterium nonmethylotrophicum TaxID=1141884 RepID=A0A4Z0NE62_9HYPH|nr:hypothetical protein EU555_35395 [Methylobacterium nonmethylotrophicum]
MHRGAAISTEKPPSILVLRYALRRFYDTHARCYVSGERLRELAATGAAFSVIDAETAEDVTAAIIPDCSSPAAGIFTAREHREATGDGGVSRASSGFRD